MAARAAAGHLGFRAGRQARRARQLAGVGREAVHAPVEAEVVALGVGEDRDARFVGGGDRPGDHGRRQRALGVVRQDDRLAPRHPAPHRPDQRLGFPGVGRPRLLLVQPRHLLVAGDDAHLAGAAAGGTADRGVLDAGIAREQGAQFGRGVVFPEQRDQHRPPAEGGYVARDVAGAAGHGVAAAQAHDRDRRLRRDPVHVAVQEAVEHGVAEDEDADAGEVEHWSGMPPTRVGCQGPAEAGPRSRSGTGRQLPG
jgi:hypothetical protein